MTSYQANSPKLSSEQKAAVLNEVALMAATGNLYQAPPLETPPTPVDEPPIWE